MEIIKRDQERMLDGMLIIKEIGMKIMWIRVEMITIIIREVLDLADVVIGNKIQGRGVFLGVFTRNGGFSSGFNGNSGFATGFNGNGGFSGNVGFSCSFGRKWQRKHHLSNLFQINHSAADCRNMFNGNFVPNSPM